MKFLQSILVAATILPLIQGHPPFPPHHPGGGRKGRPHRHLRRRALERRVQANNATSSEGDLCNTTNPFSILESGCPCFNLETITSQMNYEEAEYCSLNEAQDGLWEDSSFSASSPGQVSGSAPMVSAGSNVYFSASNYKEAGWEQISCSASLDNYKLEGESLDSQNGVGEYHSNYINLQLTEEEYGECVNVLNILKSQLPSTCSIGTGC